MPDMFNGWEEYPSNLSSIYPSYDLEYCRRRLHNDAKRLFSATTCEIHLSTVYNGKISSKSVITDENDTEAIVESHLSGHGNHFIYLQQAHSWAPFNAPLNAVLKLFTALNVAPTFLDLMHGFGQPKERYESNIPSTCDVRLLCPNLKERGPSTKRWDQGFQFAYIVTYMARTGRPDWPWSERRLAVYCRCSMHSDSRTWLILQPPPFCRFLPGLPSGNEANYDTWSKQSDISQHIAYLEATYQSWNDYIRYLESKIQKHGHDARLDTSSISGANLDFHAAFSKLQSIQYCYELIYRAILALKAINGVIDALTYLSDRYPPDKLEDNRIIASKAKFMAIQNQAKDMLDRVKQVSNLTSTLVNYKHGQATTLNTTSLERLTQASKNDEALLLSLTRATKKDSSTMKLIAAITMVYLPGAFVAALFSTSFISATFNSMSEQSSLNRKIMLHACSYVAVTVGLMTITFLGAFCWNRRIAKEGEKETTIIVS